MTAFDSENLAQIKASAPAWRAEQMEAAYKVFAGLDEPTGAEEDWRYVEFELSFDELTPVDRPGEPLDPGPFVASLPDRSGHVLIVDGSIVEIGSDIASAKRFSELETDPGSLGLVPVDHNKLAAAHAAFASDGVLIELDRGVIMETPLVVDIQGTTAGSASFPHLMVRVGENAEARIVVVYRSVEGASLLMVPEVDLEVGDGGRLRFLSVQGLEPLHSI